MRDIIRNPPGTWHTPSAVAADPQLARDLAAVAAAPHTPVVHVVLTTPRRVDENGQVGVETWLPPIVDGSVTWNGDGFPQGTATVTVSSDLARWAPGPAPLPPWGDQPALPTLSPQQGIPWAVSPFGTWLSAYRGWRDAAGRVVGVRVFDGPVMSSEVSRPGRTWRLDAADVTAMVNRVGIPYGRTLREWIRAAGGPDYNEPYSRGYSYHLGIATRSMLREAAEFYWPVEARQLAHNEVGYFEYDRLADNEPVDGWQVIGGRNAWDLVEEWHDASGLECYAAPGEWAQLVTDEPATLDRSTPDADLTRIATGSGGVVLGFTAAYGHAPNRIRYGLEVVPDAVDRSGFNDDTVTVTMGDGRTIDVHYSHGDDYYAEIWLEPTEDTDENGTYKVSTWRVDWEDTLATANIRPKGRASHRWLRKGRHTATVTLYPEGKTVAVTFSYPSYSLADWTDALWNNFRLGNPTSVRRSGRQTWHETRRVRAAIAGADGVTVYEMAERSAARMARRVVGRARTTTVDIVPLPWVMPRQTVAVDLTDGVLAQRHLVVSSTVPLTDDGVQRIDTVNPEVDGVSLEPVDYNLDIVGRSSDTATHTFTGTLTGDAGEVFVYWYAETDPTVPPGEPLYEVVTLGGAPGAPGSVPIAHTYPAARKAYIQARMPGASDTSPVGAQSPKYVTNV